MDLPRLPSILKLLVGFLHSWRFTDRAVYALADFLIMYGQRSEILLCSKGDCISVKEIAGATTLELGLQVCDPLSDLVTSNS